MARPIKEGLDYFPLDVAIDRDDKLVVVIGKYGMLGFGVVIRLMMEIYKNGYYYNWTEREQYAFSNKINVDINTIINVINECIKWGFFHQKLFESHSILTSQGIQKRFLIATNRRVKTAIEKEYCLIIQKVTVSNNPDIEDINGVIDNNVSTESTQKKRKEIKVNKIKEKTSTRQLKYAEDSSPYRLALYLHKKIMEHAEDSGVGHFFKKTNLQGWADDCRKLLELDKVERALIKEVIDWATGHSFWKTNILSASKLREQFKDLAMKMKFEKEEGEPSGKYEGSFKGFQSGRDSPTKPEDSITGGQTGRIRPKRNTMSGV